jgi:nitroreductase
LNTIDLGINGSYNLDVREAMEKRRAYRSLTPVEITEELVNDLAKHANLAPSCFNNQPTRFVFVYEPEILKNMHEALNRGNVWAEAGSMIIAVFSKINLDCDVKGRIYYLFDLGQAVAFLQLRATELGLVTHPIAGFDEVKVKEILDIPQEMTVITLVIVGKKSTTMSPVLSEKQLASETLRPERITLAKYVYKNKYSLLND